MYSDPCALRHFYLCFCFVWIASIAGACLPGDSVAERSDPQPRKRLASDSDYDTLMRLLSRGLEDPERNTGLYPLVRTLCRSAGRVADIIRTGTRRREAALDREHRSRIARRNGDMVEHLATSCHRSDPDLGLRILEQAAAAWGSGGGRFDVVAARLFAAAGEDEAALRRATNAAALGSFHALALKAVLQARLARALSARPRLAALDEALKTVSVEPSGDWPLVDVMALLSARAALVSERILWTTEDELRKQQSELRVVQRRLMEGPFIASTRRRAADAMCFDAVESQGSVRADCSEAADRYGILGAAALLGRDLSGEPYDAQRFRAIVEYRERLAGLGASDTILLVARGDAAEMVAWARPLAQVLMPPVSRGARLVVLERSPDAGTRLVLRRAVQLSGAAPVLWLSLGQEPLAGACAIAVLAGRSAPPGCPLGADRVRRLRALGPIRVALFVGRDLDSDLQDLRRYDVASGLLSLRVPPATRSAVVHLKSLSDALLLSMGSGPIVRAAVLALPPPPRR